MTSAGERVIALSYGGMVLRFESGDPDLTLEVRDPHSRFRVAADRVPDCQIHCTFGDPTPGASEPVHGGGTVWELRHGLDGEDEVTYFGAWQGGLRAWLKLTCEPSLERIRVVYRPYGGQTDRLRLGFPVDEYVMGRLLGRRGGLILHAASTIERDRAILLMGHSGAGKSTLAEVAQGVGAEVLSDDRTIVRINGRAVAWGTPWHGSYKAGSPRRATLGAVFVLVQSNENRVVHLPRARAFQEIYVRAIQPTVDAEEIRASVDAVERLVEHVPVAELHFLPVASAYELARGTVDAIVRDAAAQPEVVASKLLDRVR